MISHVKKIIMNSYFPERKKYEYIKILPKMTKSQVDYLMIILQKYNSDIESIQHKILKKYKLL